MPIRPTNSRKRRTSTSTTREEQTSSMEIAQNLQSKRTKMNYKSKVDTMTRWMLQHFPQAIDENGKNKE